MEQHQIKVSFSLGTKLLLSLVTLLVVCIGFLSFSTVALFSEDKVAYIKQTQSNEALLIGREILGGTKHVVDFLRQSLGALNPLKPVDAGLIQNLQLTIDNQSSVSGVGFGMYHPDSKVFTPVAKVINREGSEPASPAGALAAHYSELEANAFSLYSVPSGSTRPEIGVMLADTKAKSENGSIGLAYAVLPLDTLVADFSGADLVITTKDGKPLFISKNSQKSFSGSPLFLAAQNPEGLSLGVLEFSNDTERFIGSYSKPGLGIIILSQVTRTSAMRALYSLVEKFIYLGLATIGLAMIFAVLFSRSITAPINELYEATKKVAGGDFNIDLKASGRDEISALTGSFLVMSKKITDLIVENVKKVQLENELKIASTVQQTLIPPDTLLNDRVQIKAHYQSASECGGDWWGYIDNKNKMYVMIADATGHGLPSALITAAARSCFSVLNRVLEDNPDTDFTPSSLLAYANRAIFESSNSQIMMTFFIAMIDFKTDSLTFANAGHQASWVFTPTESGVSEMSSLILPGRRLGEEREVSSFEEKTVHFKSGDSLFLYTDGLVDAVGKDDSKFGKRRAKDVVQANVGHGPEHVVKSLVKDFMSHVELKPLDDDLTMVALRRI